MKQVFAVTVRNLRQYSTTSLTAITILLQELWELRVYSVVKSPTSLLFYRTTHSLRQSTNYRINDSKMKDRLLYLEDYHLQRRPQSLLLRGVVK